MIIVTFLIFTLTVLCSLCVHGYDYDNPNEWNSKYEECRGDRQSPIKLFRSNATQILLPKLQFNSYNEPISTPIEATNNGHSIIVNVKETVNKKRPSITGGGLNATYEVDSFHFHWGSKSSLGSEHELDNKKYDVELHIVHRNVKYADITEASKDPFGIAVLGIFLKKQQIIPTLSTGLQEVYDALPNLTKSGSKQNLNSITMTSILSYLNTREFLTYPGSLTTPPCSQAVTWFVFPDTIPIQSRFLKRFYNIFDDRNKPLLNNFRPTQPINGRTVIYRKNN